MNTPGLEASFIPTLGRLREPDPSIREVFLYLLLLISRMDGLLCCFSPGGETLAIATGDGRIRTFDTGLYYRFID